MRRRNLGTAIGWVLVAIGVLALGAVVLTAAVVLVAAAGLGAIR
jgi:hypothetical protein